MDIHSTYKDTGKNTINKTSRLHISECSQAKIINKLHDRAQIYKDSAFSFIHTHSAHVCILLGDRALESMLKALYITENGLASIPHPLSLNDVVQLTSRESGPDLDTVMFVHSIQFLASIKDSELIQQIQTAYLKRLLRRVDDVLTHLSRRIAIHNSGQYRSIFPE